MNCKSIEQKIATLVKEIAERRGVEAFYSILDETEPFEADHNSPLVRAFTLGVIDVEHSRPTLIRKTGTGDMNVLGNQWKIPVVHMAQEILMKHILLMRRYQLMSI